MQTQPKLLRGFHITVAVAAVAAMVVPLGLAVTSPVLAVAVAVELQQTLLQRKAELQLMAAMAAGVLLQLEMQFQDLFPVAVAVEQ